MKRISSTGLAILSLVLLLSVGALLGSFYPPLAPTASVGGYPWIYLRADQPPKPADNNLKLILVGDLFLGRGVPDPTHALDDVAPWLMDADLTIGNLEGVIQPETDIITIDPHKGTNYPILLNMPPCAVHAFEGAGFDLLSLANNHALDYGLDGLGETVSILSEAGISPLGLVPEADPVESIVTHEIRGVRLAFIAVNAIPIFWNEPDMGILQWDETSLRSAIQIACSKADVVVVSIHWGYEYETQVDPAQGQIAEAILEAGADLVFGHHPHVMQGVEIFNHQDQSELPETQIVAYSLGNFAFDQQAYGAHRGLALQVWVDNQGIRAARLLPISSGPHPRLLPQEYASILQDQLIPRVQACFKCDQVACQPVSPPRSQLENQIVDHRIDLTGDGRKESIKKQVNGVAILEDRKIVWQSPSNWQILDFALGDPNVDGRGEVLLALQKPDESGVLRSHPFIIGYRGGSYRILWGGSAVSEPILEVELGDLNGDGIEELVVLEEQPGSDKRTISVWQWHGWGFSQIWRSEPGSYQSLRFLGQNSQHPGVLCVERSTRINE